ncbi:unnamed protein product [Allacma fusca]|uniref:Uncharacterized protein n=1 Tax=Allacma fusca TaxID=39272 RepID=A0A8J2JKP5_9HEXA|nr:unnamed protein product [Allacma fusca]
MDANKTASSHENAHSEFGLFRSFLAFSKNVLGWSKLDSANREAQLGTVTGIYNQRLKVTIQYEVPTV